MDCNEILEVKQNKTCIVTKVLCLLKTYENRFPTRTKTKTISKPHKIAQLPFPPNTYPTFNKSENECDHSEWDIHLGRAILTDEHYSRNELGQQAHNFDYNVRDQRSTRELRAKIVRSITRRGIASRPMRMAALGAGK